ncbi:MAG: hypothetical protein HYX47_15165 [Burkholderiales bacterium]|nr:hypothetical protein [Burkholderiales bacterium]
MKARTTLISIALVLTSALLGGCAAGRSEVRLAGPSAYPVPQVTPNGRSVFIRTVTDERVFEQAPGNPSIPSLGFETAAGASADVKARAIGRKRSGYGMAMGDVLLQNGQTVESVVRENLSAAFQQLGYGVAREMSAGTGPVIVDVRIKRFWSWLQPGFAALSLHAEIETALQVAGGGAVTISVRTRDSRQFAGDGAWVEIVQQALHNYRIEAAKQLSGPPF